MGADQHHDWQGLAASALAWWHDVGVDTLVDEGPRDWFAAVPAPAAITAAVAATIAAPAVAAAPHDLAGFLAWRAGGDAPEAGWRSPLALPTGPADARIMVLVDCPDRDDGEALLSSGAEARLFDRMLAAIGLSRDTIHLAAVHWRRPPPGRIAPAIDERLCELAQRHVALAGAERVLLLGDAASRAILGTNTMAARGGLRALKHEGSKARAIASLHPRVLIERPASKADAWRDLQLLIGETDG
jgi:DNA polymerase